MTPGMGGGGGGGQWGPHSRHAPWGAGPPPWVNMFGGRRGFGASAFTRPAKVRRGDVRIAILDVLSGQPMNGYQVIQQIAERTQGAWKPSPGSVYPTLQQLEDEGLIRSTEAEGRKAFELNDAGHTYVAEHADDISATWQAFDETTAGDETFDLKRTISQLAPAVWQVAMAGTPQQQEAARGILSEARRKLYALLADGDDEP